MFHHTQKKIKTHETKSRNDLTRISKAEQILTNNKRQELLEKIQQSSALDDRRFRSIGTTLIHRVINHYQHLPETTNSYYAEAGGLVDHALNRAEAALHLLRQYMITHPTEALSEEQKLWLYALLTAALLQGIGKLHISFQVQLYDNNCCYLKDWTPLLEDLTATGCYYGFRLQPTTDCKLERQLTMMLARTLMPTSGFAWITTNPKVLIVWLALLNEDWDAAGALGAILVRADAIAIQRYFSQLLAKYAGQGGRGNRIPSFIDTTLISIADKEKLIGIEFICWLQQALEKRELKINQAPLLMVPGGLLMNVEIYQLFLLQHPEYKNWQAIQHSLLGLGFHETSLDKSSTTETLLTDFAIVLPNQMDITNPQTGQASTVTATELIHLSKTSHDQSTQNFSLPYLNAHGEWQQHIHLSQYNPGGIQSG
ncbi:MAG: TraI domain-containing protein [Legionella sp.]